METHAQVSGWVATPGEHAGVSNEDYHADRRAVSSSRLKKLQRSAAHYFAGLAHAEDETDATMLGSAVHCALLEPERFDAAYMVAPKVSTRSKEGKALAELLAQAAQGRTILRPEELALVRSMAAGARRHPRISSILAAGEAETVFCWEDDDTGILLKIKTDWLRRGEAIYDVKTTIDASPDGFGRQAARLAYHLSAAMYRTGYRKVTGEELPFRFIAVEKEEPFVSAIYQADREFISKGERLFRMCLHRLKDARERNEWDGYQRDEIGFVSLPPWA